MIPMVMEIVSIPLAEVSIIWFCNRSHLKGLAMNIHPLYLMLPCGISSSFAFLLPVGTPPLALVSEFAHIETADIVIVSN